MIIFANKDIHCCDQDAPQRKTPGLKVGKCCFFLCFLCDFVTNENGDFIQRDSFLVCCKADDFSKLSCEHVKNPCSI